MAHSFRLLLLILALAAYAGVADLPFFLDDSVYLLDNRYINALPIGQSYELLWHRGNGWEFLPVRDLMYKLELALFDLDPWVFHVSNLFWYFATLLAAYCAALQTLWVFQNEPDERLRLVALTTTVLFAIHPAHVEVVAWVASRKDVMACTFTLCAWAIWMRGLRLHFSTAHLCLGCLIFILAVFSKAAAVVLPLLLITATVLIPDARAAISKRVIYGLLPLLIAVTALLIHSNHGLETHISLQQQLAISDLSERAGRVLLTLFSIQWFPDAQRFTYDVFSQNVWRQWMIGLSTAGVLTTLLIFRSQCGTRRLVVLLFAWMVIPLIPYLQISPFITWSMASERFVFVSSFGVALMVALALTRLNEKWQIGVLGLIVSVGAFLVSGRVAQWHDESALWANEYRFSPAFGTAIRQYSYRNLLPAHRFDDAIQAAAQLRREDQRELLTAIIKLDESFYQSKKSAASSVNFCINGAALRQKVNVASLGFSLEVDVPHIHFVKNIEWYLNNGRIGKKLKECNAASV